MNPNINTSREIVVFLEELEADRFSDEKRKALHGKA